MCMCACVYVRASTCVCEYVQAKKGETLIREGDSENVQHLYVITEVMTLIDILSLM